MGLFRRDANPNIRRYVLLYAGGEQFVFRHGETKTSGWDLRGAIAMADYMADQGEQLRVADPETGTVLWQGDRTVR